MQKLMALFIIGVLVTGTFSAQSTAFAVNEKEKPHAPDRLLVKFKTGVPEKSQNEILKQNNAEVLDEISQIKVKILKVPEQALKGIKTALEKNPNVEYVEEDYILEPASIPNDPYFSEQWHLQKMGVPEAWNIAGTSPVTIAILDTGVDPNQPDLAGKFVSGYNFVDNNDDWSAICTHGTAVAGSATAVTNNGVGISGLAPNAKIMPIRISYGPPSCGGSYSAIIQGVVYAADNGARIANISFLIFDGMTLYDAAKYMYEKGGWVVAASGNTNAFENYKDNPYIISVGGTWKGDEWNGSSYGPYVDFAAPNSFIYTTFPGGYGQAHGTSFSSPIVAGTIALVLATNPSLTPSQAYNILKDSAVDLGAPGRDDYFGHGRVNALAAVNLAAGQPQSPSPTVPGAISNLLASVVSSSQINLSWSAPSNGGATITGYQIERQSDSTWSTIATVATTSYSDTGLVASTAYSYRVSAINGVGTGPVSNTASATTQAPAPGADPPVLVVPSIIEIEASTSSGAIVNYPDPQVIDSLNIVSGPSCFLPSGSVFPVGAQTVKCEATNSAGVKGSASFTVLVTDKTAPTVKINSPSNNAVLSGVTKISVSATDNVGVASVEVYVNDKLLTTITNSKNDPNWNTRSLPDGTYTLSAKAIDTSGNSSSQSISVKIQNKK